MSQSSEGTKTDAGTAETPAATSNFQPVTLTDEGKQVEVKSFDELVKLAQRGVAADDRFQKAAADRAAVAAERANYAESIAVTNAVRSLHQDGFSEAAWRIVAKHSGMSEDETQAVIASHNQPATPPGQTYAPQPVGYEHFTPEMKQVISETYWARADEVIKKSIEKDEVLSTFMDAKDDAGQELVRLVREKALQKSGGRPLGPDSLKAALKEVGATLSKIGTPKGKDKPPTPGAGPAPRSAGTPRPTEPPKRVPMSDPGYDAYVLAKMQWDDAQSRGK